MTLTPLQQEFVLHFGEMGSRWGINRTVGQIYALLFLSQSRSMPNRSPKAFRSAGRTRRWA
jgi:DNA-binding transcriptional regulator GbsR (MarR family)